MKFNKFYENKIIDIIEQIKNSDKIANNGNIAEQLSQLFAYAKEDNPESKGINYDSLLNFYEFLSLYQRIEKPVLSLSPESNIYACWKNKRNSISIHFLENNRLQVIIMKSNKLDETKKCRIVGICKNDNFSDLFELDDVLSLIM